MHWRTKVVTLINILCRVDNVHADGHLSCSHVNEDRTFQMSKSPKIWLFLLESGSSSQSPTKKKKKKINSHLLSDSFIDPLQVTNLFSFRSTCSEFGLIVKNVVPKNNLLYRHFLYISELSAQSPFWSQIAFAICCHLLVFKKHGAGDISNYSSWR